MKKMKIKDERVIQLTNQIQSEACLLVLFLLAASVFVKTYVLDLPVKQCAVELCILVVSAVYIAFRSALAGSEFINTSKGGTLWTIAAVFTLSLAITVFSGIRNYTLYSEKYSGVLDGKFLAALAVTFVSSVVFISVVFALLYALNHAGRQRLERKLRAEEEAD